MFFFFFRQNAGKPIAKTGPRLLSRGSSFRYSGRTQKQIIEGCRTTFRQQPLFQRFVSATTAAYCMYIYIYMKLVDDKKERKKKDVKLSN